MKHFFTTQNLTALREIALRRTADRVDRAYRKEIGKNASGLSEHILICLSAAPSNPKVIRTAARLCEAFHGQFTALHVMPNQQDASDPAATQKLKENIRLAEQMGARVVSLRSDDIPQQIAEYAKVSGITKIVLGRTVHRFPFFNGKKSFVDKLNELVPELDVYIIPDVSTKKRPYRRHILRLGDEKLTPASIGMTALLFAITTLLSLLSRFAGLNDAFVLMLYVFGILLTAMTTGNRLACVATAVLSVLTYNFCFTEPYFTLQVSEPGYGMAFLLMLVLALFAGRAAQRVRKEARQQAEKARRTEILLQASQRFLRTTSPQELMTALGDQLSALVKRSVVLYPADGVLGEPLFFSSQGDSNGADFYLTEDERGVAAWVLKNNKHAGATTGTLPSAKCLYLAARCKTKVQAVVGISLADGGTLDTFDQNLLLTLLDLFALAIDRAQER